MLIQRDIRNGRVSMGELFVVESDVTHRLMMTLERPWLDNQPDVSCIPAGRYICRRTVSPKFGETFEVTNVEGRTHILFHAGNFPEETEGCILLGVTRDPSVPAVWHSKAAHAQFMARLAAVDEFFLEIEDVDYGGAA
ncbi:MAG: DUF5675 family protein [Pseudodesulfovibrio sp.]|uniref:DUF5675 family protein n=1 Tax=Pseudodesulfovibrio sp. TaxID=2035812 RepID=UPI003D0CBE95